MRMIKVLLGIALTSLLFLGCSTKSGLIDMRKELTNKDTIKDNIEDINEILAEDSSEPDYFAEAMKTGMILSSKANLASFDSKGYNTLIDNFLKMRKKPPIKQPFFGEINVEKYNNYIDTFSIYCLSGSLGPRLPDAIITTLYTMSKLDQAKSIEVMLNSLYNHIEKIADSKKFRNKVLVGLSRFDHKGLDNTLRMKLNSLENRLKVLSTLSSVMSDHSKYLRTTSEWNYVLTLNESMLNDIVTGDNNYTHEDIKANIEALKVIALDEDVDKKYQNRAGDQILNYAPAAYYHMMIEQSSKVYALSNVLSLFEYMQGEDAVAATSKALIYSKTDENNVSRNHINHRVLYAEDFYTSDKAKVEKIVFDAIDTTIKNEGAAYRTFYYTHLTKLYPVTFAKYLIKVHDSEKDNTVLLHKLSFAGTLTHIDAVKKAKLDKKLMDTLVYVHKSIVPRFDKEQYVGFYEAAGAYLIKYKNSSFLADMTALLKHRKNIVEPVTFTKYYTSSMAQSKAKLANYKKSFQDILKIQEEKATQYLVGFLSGKDINFALSTLNDTIFKKDLKLWEISLVGSFAQNGFKKISKGVITQTHSKLIASIKNSNDDISLMAAQFAHAIGTQKGLKNSDAVNSIKKRFIGVRL